MPYIRKERRKDLDPHIEALIRELKKSDKEKQDGDINYVVTRILKAVYMNQPKYFSINRAMGVIECIKQEFYRIFAAPYEDKKRKENGDV